MPDQSIACDIGGRADKPKLGELSASGVDLRHQRDHFFPKRARRNSTFNRSGGDAGAKRFSQHKQVAGMRLSIRGEPPNIDDSCDGEPINRFGISNGMTANNDASHFGCLGKTAAQNGRNDSRWNQISRETNDVESRQRPSAHGENIG